MISGVGSKLKTISDQLAKFIIERCTKLIERAAAAPDGAAERARITDSSRNDVSTLAREAEGAEGADLALPARDRAVHRDHRADHRRQPRRRTR